MSPRSSRWFQISTTMPSAKRKMLTPANVTRFPVGSSDPHGPVCVPVAVQRAATGRPRRARGRPRSAGPGRIVGSPRRSSPGQPDRGEAGSAGGRCERSRRRRPRGRLASCPCPRPPRRSVARGPCCLRLPSRGPSIPSSDRSRSRPPGARRPSVGRVSESRAPHWPQRCYRRRRRHLQRLIGHTDVVRVGAVSHRRTGSDRSSPNGRTRPFARRRCYDALVIAVTDEQENPAGPARGAARPFPQDTNPVLNRPWAPESVEIVTRVHGSSVFRPESGTERPLDPGFVHCQETGARRGADEEPA